MSDLQLQEEVRSTDIETYLLLVQISDCNANWAQVRARQANLAVPDLDENGTPDVFKGALSLLSKPVGRFEPIGINEKGSFEWRAERSSLTAALSRYSLQHSFIPRVGELVLWCPEMDGDLFYNPDRRQFMLYSFKEDAFIKCPEWRAGTVADTPEEPVDFQDLIIDPKKRNSISQAGFRIETMPDPNDDVNKGFSRHYQYVTLRQIRPLSQWQTLLHGVPRAKLHPSIENALTLMATMSLVEKFDMSARRDKGSGKIWCQGAFLGSELLLVGDVIRFLSPQSSTRCTDILHVDKILLRLSGITSDHYEGMSRLLASKSSIRFVGRAYTLSADRSFDNRPIGPEYLKGTFPNVGTEKWGKWYAMHGDDHEYEISFGCVVGRLHEYEASRIWQSLSNIQSTIKPSLSNDVASVLAARQYAQNADARIPEGQSWLWADSRAEALALESLNGVELNPYDDSRVLDPEEGTSRSWEATLRIIDGQEAASLADRVAAGLPKKTKGRKAGTKIKDGKVVAPNRMTALAFDNAESEDSESSDDSTSMTADEPTITVSVPEVPQQRMFVVPPASKDIYMEDLSPVDKQRPNIVESDNDEKSGNWDDIDRDDNDEDEEDDDDSDSNDEREDPDDLLSKFKN